MVKKVVLAEGHINVGKEYSVRAWPGLSVVRVIACASAGKVSERMRNAQDRCCRVLGSRGKIGAWLVFWWCVRLWA